MGLFTKIGIAAFGTAIGLPLVVAFGIPLLVGILIGGVILAILSDE